MVWDQTTSWYKITTEQERINPQVDTITALRWGSYSETESKDNPACLVDLQTLKQNTYTQAFTLSVQKPCTNPTGTDTHYQVGQTPNLDPGEDIGIDAWAKRIMMEQEMDYEHINEISNSVMYTYVDNNSERPLVTNPTPGT